MIRADIYRNDDLTRLFRKMSPNLETYSNDTSQRRVEWQGFKQGIGTRVGGGLHCRPLSRNVSNRALMVVARHTSG